MAGTTVQEGCFLSGEIAGCDIELVDGAQCNFDFFLGFPVSLSDD